MWIVLDLIVIAIVLFFIIHSAKRGFVKTAAEVLGFVLAAYLSFTFSAPIAQSVYDGMVANKVASAVETSVNEQTSAGTSGIVDGIWEGMPDVVVNAAEMLNITKESVTDIVSSKTGATSAELGATVANDIVAPVLVPIIRIVIGLVMFAIIMFLVRIIVKIINPFFKLPIIGALNTTLGGVVGVVKGIIVAALVCIAISTVLVLVENNKFLIFTPETISQSTIFKYLCGINPLYSV